MVLTFCGNSTSEKFFIRLDSILIRDRKDDSFKINDGQVLIPVSVYNEMVNTKLVDLTSLYPYVGIKEVAVFEYEGPNVELKKAYNNDKVFVCNVWCYDENYSMPEYKFSKIFGDQIVQ